jgi:hypothetical protein
MGGSRAERGGTPMDASAWARERMNTMLGTLRASDAQKAGPNQANSHKAPTPAHMMAKNSRPLSETSGSIGLTGTAASPVSQRRALLLGLVLWMMGQDRSFLQACATVPLPRSATRSSRR